MNEIRVYIKNREGNVEPRSAELNKIKVSQLD